VYPGDRALTVVVIAVQLTFHPAMDFTVAVLVSMVGFHLILGVLCILVEGMDYPLEAYFLLVVALA